MICEIYDDKFDAKYLHELYDLVQGKLRYRACNVANSHTWPYHQEGSHRLFGSTIFSRSHPNFIDYVDNVHAKNFNLCDTYMFCVFVGKTFHPFNQVYV